MVSCGRLLVDLLDIVVLVFRDGGKDPFNPTWLTSHFNRKVYIKCCSATDVFVMIQPQKVQDKAVFRVAIANKPGVRPYGI